MQKYISVTPYDFFNIEINMKQISETFKTLNNVILYTSIKILTIKEQFLTSI